MVTAIQKQQTGGETVMLQNMTESQTEKVRKGLSDSDSRPVSHEGLQLRQIKPLCKNLRYVQ